jgi:TetR/AcrR family transcriptional regulator, transcriptional repressor for nem operon
MTETTGTASSSGRRRQPHDVRQEQLLDAAERVLLDRGLATATIADVAESAGVAKGTVYLYFESKTELIAALRARYIERASAQLASAIPSKASSRAKLDKFVEAFFRICVEHRDFHRLLFHEAGFSEDDAFVATRELLLHIVEEGIADGTFSASDPVIATDFVLAGVHAALVSLLHGAHRNQRTLVATVKQSAGQTLGVKSS